MFKQRVAKWQWQEIPVQKPLSTLGIALGDPKCIVQSPIPRDIFFSFLFPFLSLSGIIWK